MIHLSQALKDFLKQTDIFQNLTDGSLERIAQMSTPRAIQNGGLIFSEGENCQGSFLILSGQVKVFKESQTGREQIMNFLGQGQYLAGVPAFDGQCYTTCSVTLAKSELLYFPRDAFLSLVKQDPGLAFNLLGIFARRLFRLSQLIENLSLKAVPGRLATYILLLSQRSANRQIVELDMTKAQLSALLGTVPETLSRALTKMAHDKVLLLKGAKITILDLQRLQNLAGNRGMAGS